MNTRFARQLLRYKKMELQNFNAFGLVTMKRREILATITFISDGKPSTRTITDEQVNIKDLENYTYTFTFGVFLQPGECPFTIHNVGRKLEYNMEDIPQVAEVLEKVVGMAKRAAGISS